MFLTEANVLHYLLDRSFADIESVVDGNYRVRNFSRRNRNLHVTCGAREYFIKQPAKWNSPSRQALEREAAIYWQTRADPAFQPIQALIPESYAWDPSNCVLTLKYLAGQTSLRYAESPFAPETAKAAGAAMGALHRDMRGISNSSVFPRKRPWYLTLHLHEPGDSDSYSQGEREIIRTLRKHSDFARALDSVSEEWREETVVHGDWKLENCLLAPESGRIQVIDWECAVWGDPFGDAATMLQSYWSFWICRPSRFRIEEIRPALHALLRAYAAETDRDPVEMAPRVLRFAAARMVQTAFEVIDKAEDLNAQAVSMMQASLNIFTRPEWALAEIFGPGWN
jgi:aminoglycoside phosphotransferase (APT) family kinase protein